MPRHEIKNYVKKKNQATCAICADQGKNVEVKGWARAYCDNCGKVVCQRHRPLLVNEWTCPLCIRQQQQQLQAWSEPQSAASAPKSPFESAQPQDFLRDMATAQALYDNSRLSEARLASDSLFARLMGSKE